MDMIERVADAIARTMFAPHEFPLPEGLADKYRYTARAAIEAMREPDIEMLSMGHRAAISVHRSGVSGMTLEAQTLAECARENAAWRAMIDAALTDNQPA